MFERYTEQARRVVFFARYEASVQHAEKITTAYLLLGLVREGGPRVDAISSLKTNGTQLRSMLGVPASAKLPSRADLKREIRLTDDSKRVLYYASQEASADNSNNIDTDHLLRGLLCFSNEASAALQSMSLDLDKARAASKCHRSEFPAKTSASESALTLYMRLFGSPPGKHRILLLKWLTFLIVVTLASLLIRWLN